MSNVNTVISLENWHSNEYLVLHKFVFTIRRQYSKNNIYLTREQKSAFSFIVITFYLNYNLFLLLFLALFLKCETGGLIIIKGTTEKTFFCCNFLIKWRFIQRKVGSKLFKTQRPKVKTSFILFNKFNNFSHLI